MRLCALSVACLMLVPGLLDAEPPPFGTVLEQWNLQMSGSYAGAGITWVRDSGKFFLMDQGYSGPTQVWKLDPADPPATIEPVPWIFENLGAATTDIPIGIAWDNDRGCFWGSQIMDGNIYAGCYLLRHVWSGLNWEWGRTPSDSWCITDTTGAFPLLWVAGMEKWPGRDFFIAEAVSPQDSSFTPFLNPYLKSVVRRITMENRGRGRALVPWDSAYIIGMLSDSLLGKYDTLGHLLQTAPCSSTLTDFTVMWPRLVNPDDTVCLYAIHNDAGNTLSRISLGLLWRQLGSAAVVERSRSEADSRRAKQTVCRGSMMMPDRQEARLLDLTGGEVMDLQPGENDIRHVAPGVYFMQQKGPRGPGFQDSSVRKVVIQR